VLLCGALIAACGGEPSESPDRQAQANLRVTASERQMIEAYDSRIATHCVRVSRGLVDPQAGPSPRQTRGAFNAARRLLALASEKPGAPLGAGQDLRLFVSDVIENLEGSNCDPRMIALLASGLAEIPQP
jgi:hypothetical protein